jgi:hypothetical protein
MNDNSGQHCFLPAAPGFWELEYISEDTGGPAIARTPVAGWEVVACDSSSDGDSTYYAYPVTIHDDRRWRVHVPILGPDGRVRTTGSADYDSEEHWFEDKKKQDRARPA